MTQPRDIGTKCDYCGARFVWAMGFHVCVRCLRDKLGKRLCDLVEKRRPR